jgi:hypothetical protein
MLVIRDAQWERLEREAALDALLRAQPGLRGAALRDACARAPVRALGLWAGGDPADVGDWPALEAADELAASGDPGPTALARALAALGARDEDEAFAASRSLRPVAGASALGRSARLARGAARPCAVRGAPPAP